MLVETCINPCVYNALIRNEVYVNSDSNVSNELKEEREFRKRIYNTVIDLKHSKNKDEKELYSLIIGKVVNHAISSWYGVFIILNDYDCFIVKEGH